MPDKKVEDVEYIVDGDFEKPIESAEANALAVVPDKESKYMMQGGFIKERQLLHILQRTPKNHIYTRPAKGGGNWDYVTGTYVRKVLNFVFGFNWDFEVVSYEEKYSQVQVLGKLTVKGFNKESVTKMQFGRADIKYKKSSAIPREPLDFGNDLKAATTDALKKCAAELGIASDIYGKNEFVDIKPGAKKAPIKQESDWKEQFFHAVVKKSTGKESFEDTFKRLFPKSEYPTESGEAQRMMAQLQRKDK